MFFLNLNHLCNGGIANAIRIEDIIESRHGTKTKSFADQIKSNSLHKDKEHLPSPLHPF